MAVNWSTAAKSARMSASLALIDAGASPATLEIGATGMTTVLLTITLAKPSFVQASGVLTCLGTPLGGTAVLTGSASSARIKDGAGVVVLDGLTVGLVNSDVLISDVSLQANQGASLQSMVISHA
jgi:succinate-acetate transporter protein